MIKQTTASEFAPYPRLVADIGGTNARFAIETKPYKYEYTQVFDCKDYPTMSSAILNYLEQANLTDKIHHASLSVPTKTNEDGMFMVNSPWDGQSMQQTKKDIGIDNTIFLNDFHALALAIPHIPDDKLVQLGGTKNRGIRQSSAIIGPGTGLGMASLVHHPACGYFAVPAEGGHASFAPMNEEEIQIWEFVHKRHRTISTERLVSGPGIKLIYEALCHIQGVQIDTLPTPAEITTRGVNNTDPICRQSIDTFCRLLGTITSNYAVMTSNFNNIYIGGGIVPKIIDYFIKSDFRSRFDDKGRFSKFLVEVPIFVIMEEFPAFWGASYALNAYLKDGYIP